MKLIKTFMIAGVICLLIAGSALAWGGPAENKSRDFSKDNCISYNATGEKMPIINIITDITGKTVAEIKDICLELREDEKTLHDYLKDEGLLDEVKEAMIEKSESVLDKLLDEGKITNDQYTERLEQITDRINDENFLTLHYAIRDKAGDFYHKKATGQKVNFNSVLEITGLKAEELKDLCLELREEGSTLVDYLKEEGLYDEWKQTLLDNYEEKLESAVENNKLTEEKAAELLAKFDEKIENGTPLNRGNSFNTIRGRMHSNSGKGRRSNSQKTRGNGKTY